MTETATQQEVIQTAIAHLMGDDKVNFKKVIEDELDNRANAAIDHMKPVIAAKLFGMDTEEETND